MIPIVFRAVYVSIAWSDRSRPIPDCLKPPNGVCGLKAPRSRPAGARPPVALDLPGNYTDPFLYLTIPAGGLLSGPSERRVGICCPELLKRHKLRAAAVSQASPRLDRPCSDPAFMKATPGQKNVKNYYPQLILEVKDIAQMAKG